MLTIFCVILSGEYLAVGNIWTVSDTSDSASDMGSLRYCIANAAAADTIQFASSLAGKKITLASTLPSITKPLTIAGLGASQLTIDGGNAYTVFNFASTATATISGMTITHGMGGNGAGIHNDGNLTISGCNILSNQTSGGNGAGIYNSLNLTVLNCNISSNSIPMSGGFSGGGIYFDGSYGGSMTVSNCAFSGNYSASWGGGIFYYGNHNAVGVLKVCNSTFSGNSSGYYLGAAIDVQSGSAVINTCTVSGNTGTAILNVASGGPTMTITACTISGNGATGATGGGVYNSSGTVILTDSTVSGNTAYDGGGIYNSDILVVNDSTIAQNFASDSSYGGGGGIYNMSSASVSLANTIVAGNHNGTSPDIYGSVTANYCLIGNTTGAGTITGTGKILNQDPLLGLLDNNGGPTQTMPLLVGSPAIGKGSIALIPSGLTTDQRGLPRIVNGTVDIGAYENQPPTLTTSGATNPLMLPSTTEGIAGDDANFTISGIGLGSGDTVTLTGPTGCEVSTNSSSGFATKLCLYPNSSGTLATTTVYARICVSATTSINDYLTIADGNQTGLQVSMTVIGTVNALPILGAAKQNSNMVFSWLANATGFTLMSSTNLGSSAVWITNSTLPMVVNGTNFVTNSMTGQRMFFRLKHP